MFSHFSGAIQQNWHFVQLALQKAFLYEVISKIFSILNVYAHVSRVFLLF